MNPITPESLYDLLPAIYRVRDAERGAPLRALVTVLAEQARLMEEDVARLYDDLFIETCQEWVVPYIGDLLGVRNLHLIDAPGVFSHRARVANTIAFRRGKGTTTMLEQLAFDTTGWRARAVEFFDLLSATQYLNHLRPHSLRTPDLRDTNALELIGTAFDTTAHTADVRHITAGAARPNIPNVGLFLWRLQSYFVPRSQAAAVAGPPDGRYTFSPLRPDTHLFNRPQTEAEISHLAGEVNVPAPLRRRPLYNELEARRLALAHAEAGEPPQPVSYRYFDDRPGAAHPPVFEVFVNDATTPIPYDEVMICDLSGWGDPGWPPPAPSRTYRVRTATGTEVPVILPVQVAVDPVLGRLAFPAGMSPSVVHVSYAYGFSGDVGGGPYNRRASLDKALLADATWQIGVGRATTLSRLGVAADGSRFFTTLTDAVLAWNSQTAASTGVIVVLDNDSYVEDLTGTARIEVREGQRLLIIAADWPGLADPGVVEPDERRPHLQGDVEIIGTAPARSDAPGELILDGFLLEGTMAVAPGHLGQLSLAHTTLTDGLAADGANGDLRVRLHRTISGPIILPETIQEVHVADSILLGRPLVDSSSGAADHALAGSTDGAAAGPEAVIERTTVLGGVHVKVLHLASNVIFVEPVVAERVQTGCVRFSYVPPGLSRTPRRYRCQPELAVAARAEALGIEESALPAAERRRVQTRVVPGFTSTRYGEPGFAQLNSACPVEIRTGAEDESEMGAFSHLKQPQRLANLQASLDEYLRFGLDAGLIFAT